MANPLPVTPEPPAGGRGLPAAIKPLPMFQPDETPCCGPPVGPPAGPYERPGYRLWPFVEEFIDTPAGATPLVKSGWSRQDYLGTMLARATGVRNNYMVAPGLYALGRPGPDAEVVVTANYKLTFDTVRRELAGLDVWLLVLDSRGINVWCAAGKKTFGTDEVVRRVKAANLDLVVKHRRLILPQLGATGVSGLEVKRGCGFKVIWGPVNVKDLPAFIAAGMKPEPAMRRVTFRLSERLVLIPIELAGSIKPALYIFLALLVFSGIGPHVFSFGEAWRRGLLAGAALLTGIASGAILAPALLPWLPGPAFSLKGVVTGLAGGLLLILGLWDDAGVLEKMALFLFILAISSYLAMNFTGSTPFTSPSGVEKEMRKAIPMQVAALFAALAIWITSGFLG